MLSASGAIAAKAKAMNGQRITKDQYEELIRKKSVSEIAQYLKSETCYKERLKDVRESVIHRGQLEHLLRQDLYQRLDKLMRYVDTKQRSYYIATLKELEIDQILARVRMILSGDFEYASGDIPLYFKRYSKLNMQALMLVRTYEELIEGCIGTPYYDLLKQFQTKDISKFDYTGCEHALHRHYIEHVMSMIEQNFKRSTKKVLKQMWSTRVELDNITKIYRYKKFFHVGEDVIRASLMEVQGSIPKGKLHEMLAAESAEAFLKLLAESPYHLHMDEKEFVYIEYYADRINYHLAKRHMHYDSSPAIVYSAYQLLAEREIENLINIIEGVRYHVPPEEINTMLIYEKE